MEQGVQNSGSAGIGPISGAQTNVQAQTPGTGANMVSEKDHKELEAFATRNRQLAIQMATEAAKANPKLISTIEDTKVQNAVARELYGLENLAQVKAVYGDEYWKSSEKRDDGEEDKVSTLERKLRMFETKSEFERVEQAVSSFKASNPSLIKSEKDEEALRNEMSLISTKLSPEERVKKASRIAFGDSEANKANSLINLSGSAGATPSAAALETINAAQEEDKKRVSAIAAFAFRNFPQKK